MDIYEIHFPVFITEINLKTSLLPRIIHKQSVAYSTHLNNYKKESDYLLSLLQEDISREKFTAFSDEKQKIFNYCLIFVNNS